MNKEPALEIYPDDVFLASYPRSGNTWLRFLLAGCIHNPPDLSFERLMFYAPDYHFTHFQEWDRVPRPRIIKSHTIYRETYPTVIYCYRDARAVLPSMYKYTKSMSPTPPESFDSFFADFMDGAIFRDEKIGSWAENVSGWLYRVPLERLICYEDLVVTPERILRRVLTSCGFDIPEDRIKTIVERYEMKKMMVMEDCSQAAAFPKTQDGFRWVGGRDSTTWKDLCSPQQQQRLLDEWGDLLEKLGYEV